MRIATWNIEWFVNLFDARGRLLEDDERSSRYKVSRADQLRGIAHVLRRIDADAIMVRRASRRVSTGITRWMWTATGGRTF